jgi:hypothetical protein
MSWKKRLANLASVKSLVTLALGAAFLTLAVRGDIDSATVMSVFMVALHSLFNKKDAPKEGGTDDGRLDDGP